MRLNHLDILEQCFRDKFLGYNKDDVDTFLHLVAENFKEITEELDLLKKEIDKKKQDTGNFNEKDLNKIGEIKNDPIEINPEIIKEKAKRIINAAREHANQHKKKAEHELSNLKREIEKIRQEKKTLIATIKMSVQESHVLQKNKK